MLYTDFTARKNPKTPLLAAAAFLLFGFLGLANNKANTFSWLHTNEAGKIATLVVMAAALYVVLKFFYSLPVFVINDTGIHRKKFIFFGRQHIAWENIYYYYFTEEKTFDTIIQNFGLKLKEPEIEIIIDLRGLDKSIVEIEEVMALYRQKYGFLKLL